MRFLVNNLITSSKRTRKQKTERTASVPPFSNSCQFIAPAAITFCCTAIILPDQPAIMSLTSAADRPVSLLACGSISLGPLGDHESSMKLEKTDERDRRPGRRAGRHVDTLTVNKRLRYRQTARYVHSTDIRMADAFFATDVPAPPNLQVLRAGTMQTDQCDPQIDARTHQQAIREGFRCDDQTLKQQHVSVVASIWVP